MNRPIPDKIRDAPTIRFGLEFFYQAFLALHSTRAIGFSDGPIPWTATQHYCETFAVEDEQREDLFYFVERLDKAFLDWRNKKAAKSEGHGRSKKVR